MKVVRKSAFVTVTLSAVVIILFCFSSLSTPSGISSAPTPISGPAKILKAYPVNQLGSLNWAGYAISSTPNSVTLVKGSWIEPAIKCPSSTTLQLASFWVGIDGLTSLTVEQTGTLAQCSQGTASYYAWYEFYPNVSVPIATIVIHPGDVILAQVRYLLATGKFNTTIQDLSTGKSSSHVAAVPSAQRSSAEWIAEAPSSNVCTTNTYYVCALANFGTVSFGKGTTLVSGTDTARVSGITGPISKFGTKVDSLEMLSLTNTPKAIPSALKSSGTSFSVTWASAGP
jgi:hypothetical protein